MGGFRGLKNCSFCEYKNKLTSMVRRHERQSHGDKALECTVDGCGVRLPYNRLARHVREKHCMKESSNQKEKINNNSESNESSHEQIENEKFTDLSLNLNKSAVLGEFLCPRCDKNYKNRYSLRKHFNQVHEKIYKKSIKEKKYQCNWPLCDESFTCASKLEGHLNSHKGEKPYECEHCGKSFSVKYEFNRHLKKYHLINLRHFNEKIDDFLDNECINNVKN